MDLTSNKRKSTYNIPDAEVAIADYIKMQNEWWAKDDDGGWEPLTEEQSITGKVLDLGVGGMQDWEDQSTGPVFVEKEKPLNPLTPEGIKEGLAALENDDS